MNDFIHTCPKCNKSRNYRTLKDCWIDGNDIGGRCKECNKPVPVTPTDDKFAALLASE